MSCAHAAGIRPATFGVLRLPRSVVVGAQQRFAIANIAAEFGTSVLVCTAHHWSCKPSLALPLALSRKSAGPGPNNCPSIRVG